VKRPPLVIICIGVGRVLLEIASHCISPSAGGAGSFIISRRVVLNQRLGGKPKIHKPEGKDESRFSLKSKRNINVTTVQYILTLFGPSRFYLDKSCHYWDKQNVWAFGRCVQNDSGSSREEQKRTSYGESPLEQPNIFNIF